MKSDTYTKDQQENVGLFFLPKIGSCVYTVYIRYIQYIHTMEENMNIIISNSSQDPIYVQIRKQLSQLILNGGLKGGDQLPSIRSLAKELQISVITTKRAYEELEKEGYIETVAGKGTYVSRKNNELLKEQRLRLLESKAEEIVNESKALQLSLEDLQQMIACLYEGE
ncbi:transcriptional regulator, GntR family [Bacillus thuringiensis str. Al Hakam]|nr:transcriptional regulator, GntR family [Bacillus thuringiensis str. Al Hakam]